MSNNPGPKNQNDLPNKIVDPQMTALDTVLKVLQRKLQTDLPEKFTLEEFNSAMAQHLENLKYVQHTFDILKAAGFIKKEVKIEDVENEDKYIFFDYLVKH